MIEFKTNPINEPEDITPFFLQTPNQAMGEQTGNGANCKLFGLCSGGLVLKEQLEVVISGAVSFGYFSFGQAKKSDWGLG